MFESTAWWKAAARHGRQTCRSRALHPAAGIFKILETQERGAAARSSYRCDAGLANTQNFYGVEFEGERTIEARSRASCAPTSLRHGAPRRATACAREEEVSGEMK